MNTKPPFESVVAEHGARVLRVCRAVIGPDEAEDAASETFLAALRAYPDLPADTRLEAWLVTVAHRKALDAVRRRRRRAVPVADPPEPRHDPAGLTSSTFGRPGHDDGEVWTAVARLPDRQRLCLAYHYLGGLTFPQVAEIVGGSADAARRAAHDGIRTLRASYPSPETGESR